MTLSSEDLDAIKSQIDSALKESVWKVTIEQPKVREPRNEGVGEREKLQFDYAWKWFAYHADQRIKMFNYMLLAVGIFATAVVGALNNGAAGAAIAVCLCAGLILLVFSRFDRRNRDLVKLGEDVLRQMEEKTIFASQENFSVEGYTTERFALLRRQDAQDKKHRERWGFIFSWLGASFWRGRHRFWLPAVAYGLAIVFLMSAAWLWRNPASFAKPGAVIRMPDSLSVRLQPQPAPLPPALPLPAPSPKPPDGK